MHTSMALTEQESKVIFFLLQFGNPVDARNYLSLSPNTFRQHLKNAYTKIGYTGHLELLVWARHNDIL